MARLSQIPTPLQPGTCLAADGYYPGGGPFGFGAHLNRMRRPSSAHDGRPHTVQPPATDAIVVKGIFANDKTRFVFRAGRHDAVALEGVVGEKKGLTGDKVGQVVRGIISGLTTDEYQRHYGFPSWEGVQRAGILLMRNGDSGNALLDVAQQELVAAGFEVYDAQAYSMEEVFRRIGRGKKAGAFDLQTFPEVLGSRSLFRFHPARPGTIGEPFKQIFSAKRVGQFLT